MPIIIWGWRGITSTLDHGEFFCPRCDAREEYSLMQNRPYFTLFFIPIFPVGGAEKYVQCRGCNQTYTEDVLNYEPPSEAERTLHRYFEELQSGTSLEIIEQKLVNHGVEAQEARRILRKMCEGQPSRCECGQHFHPSVTKCSHCGADL